MANFDVSAYESVGLAIVRTQISQALDHTALKMVHMGIKDWSPPQLPAGNISNTEGDGINFNNNQMDLVFDQLWKITAEQPDQCQAIMEKLAFLFITAPHRAELTALGCIGLKFVDMDMPMIPPVPGKSSYVGNILLQLRYNLPNPN